MLTESEVSNLKTLKSNIHYADEFLKKGVKLTKAVGEIEDIYTIENSPKRCNRLEGGGDGILNIKTHKGHHKHNKHPHHHPDHPHHDPNLHKEEAKDEKAESDGEDNKSTK
jgi:hypothetical protein